MRRIVSFRKKRKTHFWIRQTWLTAPQNDVSIDLSHSSSVTYKHAVVLVINVTWIYSISIIVKSCHMTAKHSRTNTVFRQRKDIKRKLSGRLIVRGDIRTTAEEEYVVFTAFGLWLLKKGIIMGIEDSLKCTHGSVVWSSFDHSLEYIHTCMHKNMRACRCTTFIASKYTS